MEESIWLDQLEGQVLARMAGMKPLSQIQAETNLDIPQILNVIASASSKLHCNSVAELITTYSRQMLVAKLKESPPTAEEDREQDEIAAGRTHKQLHA